MFRNKSTRNLSPLPRSNSAASSKHTSTSSVSVSISDKNSFPYLSNFCNKNEADRIVSDQGLVSSLGRRTNTLSRRVKDKSYYEGVIHLKCKEICDEIKKLQKEVYLLSADQITYFPFKKKAESKAVELQDLQKTLANYNIVDEMFHSGVQLSEAKEELQNLEIENEKDKSEVEKLFDATKQKEITIKELETDLSQENNVSEILKTENSHLCEKLEKLKQMDSKMKSTLLKQDEELKILKSERIKLENRCNGNKYLTDALKFFRRLRQLERERDELFSKNIFTSSSDENEYLEKYKTECNVLLDGMMLESRNLEIKIKEVENELRNVTTENNNLYSERREKYSKMKEKEIIIDEYLSAFCKQQLGLLRELQQLHLKIIKLLRQISTRLEKLNPSNSDNVNFDVDSMNLEDCKKAAELKQLHLKLTSDLNDINSIEKKLEEEKKRLKEEISRKEKELPKLSRINDAKEDMKNKEKELTKKLNEIKRQKSGWKLILEEIQKRHDSLENKLKNNKTYIMLSRLEKRWHSLEEENFSLRNFITLRNSEKSYLLVKEEVKKIYSELNKML